MNSTPLLSLKNLTVRFKGSKHPVIDNLNLDIQPGQILGLAGASGSGKSLTALSILALLPASCQQQGVILFANEKLNKKTKRQWQTIRGKRIAMVFQEPMTALNPVQAIGKQINEVLSLHTKQSRQQRQSRVRQLLHQVQLKPQIAKRYPHQLSGGQKQRVVIAIAMACEPELLICDEPTTALDVTTQKALLLLLKDLQAKHDMSMLFISHDLAVMQEITDAIAIMKKGRIVEQGATNILINHPKNHYTRQLIKAANFDSNNPIRSQSEESPLLDIKQLSVSFKQNDGWRRYYTQAIDQASLMLNSGDIMGLVGESGSGKTTLGRCLVGLQPYANGSIEIKGQALNQQANKSIQMIFQDPFASLNPRMTLRQTISEPMDIYGLHRQPKQRHKRLAELMAQVDLDVDMLSRYPHAFSGGQRQRLAIARALACEPELLICDEAVTALDVLIQQHIIKLLSHLVKDHNLTLLFISHDISVVKALANRMAVMYQGRIVEQGRTEEIINKPKHPYTQQLLASVPTLRSA